MELKQQLRKFCSETSVLLKSSGTEFGAIYVARMMEFFRVFKYNKNVPKKFGAFSSGFGGDFFDYVLKCLNGHNHKITYTDPKTGETFILEYEKNFKEFIDFYRS